MCAVRTRKISCPAPWYSPPKALDTLHQGLRLYVRGLSNLIDGCGMDVASGRPFAIRAHAGLDLADLVAQGPRSRLLDPYILFSVRTA
jgi:hypothetical protein